MDRTRRQKSGKTDHHTSMIRATMEEPAWRALSPVAQALYPWLKLEWHGPKFNNNGKIRLSVRQAAERIGVALNTAAKGFHDLQAKGFIVVTEPACLGLEGEGNTPSYEITELGLPHSDRSEGRKLYRAWKVGRDYAVHKATANNPHGKNGRQKNKTLSQNLRRPVLKMMTNLPEAS
ncbi:hypothetical protein Q669_00560 [Labrenzia sp. C1B10]|nr:hypothetical protein Q669_00560 [Labrenzia sp. C1B10]ERS00949.1 hypothetical protein Q675_09085 [Labrenzia sp. C1B70]